ncbi:hemerythrin HHE cation binding domain protein [bacterium BMS3Bbin07]|nr:hemerythrin HHE cation binding domain protein [bacterium BMS3Bbin07]
MLITDEYRRQHEEILELVNELSGYLYEQKLKNNALEARKILSKLAGALKVHLAMEDNSLYPRLLASNDKEIREVARQFIEEIGGITPVFNNYLNKWPNPASIESNPLEFINETNELFNALKNRIYREDNILYPLIDKT